MAVISIDEAKPGMMLASPVMDRKGRVIIPQGIVLSEKHISGLKRWGISTINVKVADSNEIKKEKEEKQLEQDISKMSPEIKKRIEEIKFSLDSMFRKTDDVNMILLKEVAKKYLIKKAMGGSL